MTLFAIPRPEQYLLPSERRVLRCRRHWAKLTRDIVFTVVVLVPLAGLSWLVPVGTVVAAVVHTVLWYAMVIVVTRLALVIADWWDDLIMITDERLLNVSGLFASRMVDTPISKITDRRVEHSIIGNLLGYGTIVVESAGHASLQRLRFVPEPLTVYEAIAKLTSKKGLPPPVSGGEQKATHPSIEDKSAEWPAGGELDGD